MSFREERRWRVVCDGCGHESTMTYRTKQIAASLRGRWSFNDEGVVERHLCPDCGEAADQ